MSQNLHFFANSINSKACRTLKGFSKALLAGAAFLALTSGTVFGQSAGFSISVDGELIAGSKTKQVEDRATDVDLSQVDIQVKFDGLGVEPYLNVSTEDLKRSYRAGETVTFKGYSNYPQWIASAEVRIINVSAAGRQQIVATVPVDKSGVGYWTVSNPSDNAETEYEYVYRVYDAQGRYDETLPLSLKVAGEDYAVHLTDEPVVSAGEAEDRTNVRNIPVYGGAVTVYGANVPQGFQVSALGQPVTKDKDNKFVMQQILPPGEHAVSVEVSDGKDQAISFDRHVNIPHNEWFYVGLADLTLGKRFGSGILAQTAPGEFDRTYSKGRLAFYLKGKIQGRYILTAAADTGEDELENLFRGLDQKDPRAILKRIDPDEFYPVYGDDSTKVEDAPTQGRFYIRLERDDSHVLWGNYKTKVKGTYFIRNERALYGAQAVLRSNQTTSHGERIAEAEVYASQPDTLPQRDTFRGTGGSAYFLTRQDITQGSETISIESRDPLTGRVISTTLLAEGKDYRIDYVQGVIILNSPLASTATSGDLISDGALGDVALNLVAQYEYTPTTGDIDGYSYGGRGKVWLNDHIRVGVSGIHEEAGAVDNEVVGADVHVRLGNNSFVEAEIAKSKGPGFGSSYSNNGGLSIDNIANAGINGRVAHAFHAKGQVDLADIDPSMEGIIGGYYEKREAGFSSYSHNTTIGQRVWGAHAEVKASDYLSWRLAYEDYRDDGGKEKREGNAEVEYRFDKTLALRMGVKHTHLDTANAANIDPQEGTRVDVGARLTYTPDEDNKLYVFGQKTVKREGNIRRNDRYGLGFETQITEKVGVRGEVSHGTTGWGGLAALTYDPTADDHYYVGYELDPDRTLSGSSLIGSDLGGLVIGAKRRYNDQWAAYVENTYDMFGERTSLATTYGVSYTPNALWTVKGGVEYGALEDPMSTDLDRLALSLSVGYKDENAASWKLTGETRFEDSDDATKDRTTYLLAGTYSYKVHDDWRFIASLDAVISDSDQSSVLDGDYVEASLGYAYRPVDNDRFNALVKYAYLYDLPGPDQITVNNGALGPAQKSHVFTADMIYDLDQYWSVGAKYGFRIGEVSADRTSHNFTRSSAHLGVLRADYHLVKNWDLFAEARVLKATELQAVDFGFLTGVYRHLGDNLKVGVGYNFGKFSDDVTDLTYNDGGVFLNMVGKF